MTKSTGIVRRIFEEDGKAFVSFTNHDGYFELPAGNADARRKADESLHLNKEIAFLFNKKAKILFLGEMPEASIKPAAGIPAPGHKTGGG